VFERRWVRRKNLHNTPLFASFLRPTRLQEPVLGQVIVLFRSKPKKIDRAAGGVVQQHSEQTNRDWTIHLKMFQHIPMADAEIVFPETKIRMGSFDLAVLIVSSLAAIPAVLKAITEGGGAASVIAIGLMLYMVKVVGRYLNMRNKYMARMTRNLYEKNLDNSVGVLQYLVDSLEEQEYKEAVLAYFVLWRDGPMTEAELDSAVERFVHQQFNLEIDFEVDDALRKVVDRGDTTRSTVLPIVAVDGNRDGAECYRAKPLEDALRILDEKWDNLFQYNV
jgi:hypothetical protein